MRFEVYNVPSFIYAYCRSIKLFSLLLQYNCTSSGVEIILEGMSILCSCEGEEVGDLIDNYMCS